MLKVSQRLQTCLGVQCLLSPDPLSMCEANAKVVVCHPRTPVTKWEVEAGELPGMYGPCILVCTVANIRKPVLTEIESEDT